MVLLLLYASLFTCILPVFSLSITVQTQPHPLVNASTSVLLAWSSDDPSNFFIAVRRSNTSDVTNLNFTSSIQPVDNFITNRDVSVVFLYAGLTFVEATKTDPNQADANTTFAQSDPFQVDENPTGVISTSYTRDADFSSPTSSATVSSTVSASTASALVTSATSATPSKHEHKAAIIAGVVCGAFLLALITTILLIWRYRKRQSRAPSRAFLNDLDDKRQPRTSRNDRPLNDPPPAYSPRISRAASKLFRWARGDDDPVASKTP
ncbi:hypothetical protein ARMSODRAFT_964354 [Armillaria solidipes]|uniref:Mid2 domain-containing protein n=1 Tax=Armillaria solidipes TaxID=1076256 RepID=A0A2H3ATR9_9AGAR|nr:hypothetical protein ARMSODRAFT_964354 [Armillaria solidipes]